MAKIIQFNNNSEPSITSTMIDNVCNIFLPPYLREFYNGPVDHDKALSYCSFLIQDFLSINHESHLSDSLSKIAKYYSNALKTNLKEAINNLVNCINIIALYFRKLFNKIQDKSELEIILRILSNLRLSLQTDLEG